MSRTARAAIVGTAVLLGLVALAPAALAHAALVSSTPADGAQLDSSPSTVTMTFSETPDPKLSVVHVLDSGGTDVEAGLVANVQGGAKELGIAVKPNLPDGVYTVSWRVVSQVDGHVTAGAFAFGVGVFATRVGTTAVPSTPGPSPLSVVGKVLLYAGLSLLVGAAATGLVAFGGRVPARRPLLVSAGVFALAGAIAMVLAERATVGVPMRDLLSSGAGRAYIWLVVFALLTAGASVVAATRPSTKTLTLAGGTAAAAMLVRVIGGHAAAAGTEWVQVGVQWLHVLAVGVWVGGLLPVALLVRERRATGSPPSESEVRRFSTMAACGLSVVVATGIVRAVSGMGVHEVLHIFSTSYGTTLAIKVAVVAGLIGLGALNRYRSIPRLAQHSGMLARVLSLEIVAALVVFTMTGVLTGFAPRPASAGGAPRITEIVATGSDVATTMKVRLAVTPGAPGRNAYQFTPSDYDTGAPIRVVGVTLSFQAVGRPDVGASSIDLKAGSAGTWVGQGTQLSIQGVWTVTATIQTATKGVEIPLTLTTASPPERITVARQSGEPDIYTITLPAGDQLQAYNDPGSPGTNQLHVTAFDTAGKELPLASVTMTAISPQGTPQSLDATRFSAGHFVASVTLTTGNWRFELSAATRRGRSLLASFQQTIG
jgi:copper transport protein